MNNKIYKSKLTVLSLMFCGLYILSGNIYGQTANPAPSPSNNQNQVTADENFELNITQKRITETDFARSTDVKLSNAESGGLRVEVGVGVRAESIDVIMRGIYGRVRFRASLESLRQKIEQLQKSTVSRENPNPPQP